MTQRLGCTILLGFWAAFGVAMFLLGKLDAESGARWAMIGFLAAGVLVLHNIFARGESRRRGGS